MIWLLAWYFVCGTPNSGSGVSLDSFLLLGVFFLLLGKLTFPFPASIEKLLHLYCILFCPNERTLLEACSFLKRKWRESRSGRGGRLVVDGVVGGVEGRETGVRLCVRE